MTKSRSEHYYRVVPTHTYEHPSWATTIFQQWGPRKIWNGQHQRLQTQDSPCISACTTATNLSSLGDFQSNSTINNFKKMSTLEENLRMTIPEIEPLQVKTDFTNAQRIQETRWNRFGLFRRFAPFQTQFLTAIMVSWVSMIIGYCSAYTSPATDSMKRDLQVTADEVSWITSLMPLGALLGGILGGPLIENLGRKWTILMADVLFLCAWTINYFAQNHWYMYVSRMISGSSVGILSLTLPVYLAETIQPEVRGSLGLLPTAFGNIGILLCYLFGNFFEWRSIALVGIILSVPFLSVCWVIRETPRFLISKGKEDETRSALQWLRGSGTDIDKEFHELKKSQEDSADEKENIYILFSYNNIKLIGIVLGLMFFQQFSGINAVIFYTTDIFKEAESTLDEAICTTIVGVVNFISTFIAAVLIDRLGRKVLLYISSVTMVLSLSTLGAYFFMKTTNFDLKAYGFIPLASFVVYVLGFSLGYGPIPWLMMGEILPAKIRGPAASLATAFNWTCTFIVTKMFLLITKKVGFHFTFWLLAVIMLVGFLFTIFIVPETRGQSLADIERKLAGIKVRRMSSVANLKPMPSSF